MYVRRYSSLTAIMERRRSLLFVFVTAVLISATTQNSTTLAPNISSAPSSTAPSNVVTTGPLINMITTNIVDSSPPSTVMPTTPTSTLTGERPQATNSSIAAQNSTSLAPNISSTPLSAAPSNVVTTGPLTSMITTNIVDSSPPSTVMPIAPTSTLTREQPEVTNSSIATQNSTSLTPSIPTVATKNSTSQAPTSLSATTQNATTLAPNISSTPLSAAPSNVVTTGPLTSMITTNIVDSSPPSTVMPTAPTSTLTGEQPEATNSSIAAQNSTSLTPSIPTVATKNSTSQAPTSLSATTQNATTLAPNISSTPLSAAPSNVVTTGPLTSMITTNIVDPSPPSTVMPTAPTSTLTGEQTEATNSSIAAQNSTSLAPSIPTVTTQNASALASTSPLAPLSATPGSVVATSPLISMIATSINDSSPPAVMPTAHTPRVSSSSIATQNLTSLAPSSSSVAKQVGTQNSTSLAPTSSSATTQNATTLVPNISSASSSAAPSNVVTTGPLISMITTNIVDSSPPSTVMPTAPTSTPTGERPQATNSSIATQNSTSLAPSVPTVATQNASALASTSSSASPSSAPSSVVATSPLTSMMATSIIDLSPPSTVMATTLTPTPTKEQPRATSSSIATTINETYYEYTVTFTLTSVEEEFEEENEGDLRKLNLLIKQCKNEYTKANSPYFLVFQTYIEKKICELYDEDVKCSVSVTKLECGSLKSEQKVTTTKNSTEVIKDKIETGAIGGFVTNKTFESTFVGKSNIKPTKKASSPWMPEVYVIVTMRYTWSEFCGVVEKHFKERITERSYDTKGNKLKPSDVYIINREVNCENPDDKISKIKVMFVITGENSKKTTTQVGNELIDLVNSRQTRKLGNLFEDKIIKVEFGGDKAPKKSGLSDEERIWLAVGVIIGVLLVLFFLYMCCCRKTDKGEDPDHGPNYFAMDNVDASNSPRTAIDNRGFDDIEGGHTPLTQRITTFKGAPEDGNSPIMKSENEVVSALPPEDEEKDAPLGEGEETDDELGMTVPDVAIESESEEQKDKVTPAGTLPITPSNPSHMAIDDLAKFLEGVENKTQKDKEYEDLDKSMTDPITYPIQTREKNRSAALVPNPETRIKLPGESDYINANHVKDHRGKDRFIVTQHPLSNTMRDFWSMVWAQNVSVIVMVNDKENDLENYHNYWLNHKNSLTIYGHMQVKTDHMESRQGFQLTQFVVQNSQESDITKNVSHFRFTDWTDGGIADADKFAEFVRAVEKAVLENCDSPVVVHCSDGQGLTGVFITANIGLRVYNESDKKSMINVFDCVDKMRKDRNGFVNTKELYNFIFKVLSALTKTKESADSKL